MDLPTCPACGQSVLDEEEKDCPFCGASMSGKPQARKPTAPAKTAKQVPAAKPKPAAAPASSPKAAEKPSVDDDPFAVDSAAEKKKAIPLRSEPTQGRAHEVVCPMCETTGYTSTKAAGRSVYCCNSECLVRVFTAPELPAEEPTEKPVSKGISAPVRIFAALLIVASIGAGVWYFLFRPPPDPTIGGQYYQPGNNVAADDAADAASDDGENPATATQSSIENPRTPQDIRAASLQAMAKATIQRDNNRSKSYCRRLTATALAVTGDRAGAQRQMDRLQSLRPAVPHYQIEPLVKLSWQAIDSGDDAVAGKILDRAVAASSTLPQRGQTRLIFAADLAAALVAVNRLQDVQALIGNEAERTEERQYAAQLSAMRATGQFNADAFAAEIPINGWQAPQTTAVIVSLVAHGKGDTASRWATGRQDMKTRSEATVVWAEQTLQRALSQSKSIDMAAIEQVAAGIPSAGQAKMYARLAGRILKSDSKGDADALLEKARGALAKTAPSEEFVLPSMAQLVDFQLPEADASRMNALAAAELMLAESLAGNSDKSIEACRLSMQFLRGITPSPLAIGKLLNTIADEGATSMRTEFKRVLKLKSDNDARLAFNAYRRNCGAIDVAARTRFDIQQAVFEAAIGAGLLDYVMQEMTERSEQADLNLREPWATTRAAWLLKDRYERAGNADAAKSVQAMLTSAAARRPRIDQIVQSAEALIAEGRFNEAMGPFGRGSTSRISAVQRSLWRLRLTGRLIATSKFDDAFDFVGGIDNTDAAFRDSALWFAAAQATQIGPARTVWKIGQKAAWSATEVVSIYGGLIETLNVPASPKAVAAKD